MAVAAGNQCGRVLTSNGDITILSIWLFYHFRCFCPHRVKTGAHKVGSLAPDNIVKKYWLSLEEAAAKCLELGAVPSGKRPGLLPDAKGLLPDGKTEKNGGWAMHLVQIQAYRCIKGYSRKKPEYYFFCFRFPAALARSHMTPEP